MTPLPPLQCGHHIWKLAPLDNEQHDLAYSVTYEILTDPDDLHDTFLEGSYSISGFKINLKRRVSPYVVNFFFPSFLIVLTSFVREPPDMMSAKFWAFWPPPPCPHLDLIYTMKFMQPPLLRPLIHDPFPPLRCGHHIWKLPN